MDYNKVQDLIKFRSENKLTIKFHSKYGEVILRNPLFKEQVQQYSIKNGQQIEDEDFYIGFQLNLMVYPEEYDIDEELLGVLYDVGETLFNEFVFMDEDQFEKKLNDYQEFVIEVSNFYEDYALNLKLYQDMTDEEISNLTMDDFFIKVQLVKRKIDNLTQNQSQQDTPGTITKSGQLKKEYKDTKKWKELLDKNKDMFNKINGGK